MENTVIEIRLKPGAKNDRISLTEEGIFDIGIKARPIEGKANAYLIKMLSKLLKVSKSSIEIVRGEKSRQKAVLIKGKALSEIENILTK